MSVTTLRLAAIGLACALAGVAAPASAQLLTERNISYAVAKTIAATALETCVAKGFRVSVVVVDRAGETVAAFRGDGASPHTMENARRKAYTARTFRRPTAEFAKRMETLHTPRQQATLPHVIGIPGGLPIKAGEEVIGGVGISGSPGGNDEPCAQAGIDKAKEMMK